MTIKTNKRVDEADQVYTDEISTKVYLHFCSFKKPRKTEPETDVLEMFLKFHLSAYRIHVRYITRI